MGSRTQTMKPTKLAD